MDRVTDQPFFEFVDEFHNACRVRPMIELLTLEWTKPRTSHTSSLWMDCTC
jgi:hypothetical protein